MANSSRMTRGSIPRALQYGLDTIIDQNGKDYKGEGDKIFETVQTEKGYYEMMQLAGMGIATRKNEGSPITYDSIDQSWVFRVPVYTFNKSARITREMIKDNVYENLLPRIAREQLKALAHARDIQQASILNSAFDTGVTYGDGKALSVSDHPIQAGGTSSNVLAVAADLSEDSLEAMSLLIDGFVNDDGLVSQYDSKQLVVPSALKFEAARVLKSPLQSNVASNNVNVLKMDGYINEIVVWKRLSDSDAYFVTTTAENGLILCRREGIYTSANEDYLTGDTVLQAAERYAVSVGDWRKVVGTPGA